MRSPPEYLHELRSRTLKENQPESEIIDNYLTNLQLLGEVAQIMLHLAPETTMIEMLPKINSN
ncbi:hypothetical protein PN437_11185 [Microcystis aeruginosa CS-564/01]|uniref:hypothetical protein n=1 Tax=Microcystis aeruginosa TaxID=1126 RepID=UPI00232DB8FA|nr:hypothetical protein [Microcystis aeruginosa]MDB9425449.1 hypothetical protein [Microcystis aeruginosa CS-564/01]